MKQLLVMRAGPGHAEETPPHPSDQGLSADGKRDAHRMGELLLAEDLVPKLVLGSTWRRATQTAVAVSSSCEYEGEIVYRPELADGELDAYLAVLHALPDTVERVLVIGHSPAVDDLVSGLCGLEKWLSPGALAHLRLPVEGWPMVSVHLPGGLANLWHPEDLAALSAPK